MPRGGLEDDSDGATLESLNNIKTQLCDVDQQLHSFEFMETKEIKC